MAPLNRRRTAFLLLVGVAAQARAQPPTLAPWAPLIAEASRRFGVPSSWVERVILAESGGRTTLDGRPIRSRAHAIGLMQLMPATWADMRAQWHLGFNPDDPHDNILAGTAYLRAMYDRFGYPGLFAAYNAGPARYATAIATGARLPDETLAYLATVTGTPAAVPRPRRQAAMQTLFVLQAGHADAGGSASVTLPADGLFVVRGDAPPSH